jgi:protein involved in polysaccharide export with SLBB domain
MRAMGNSRAGRFRWLALCSLALLLCGGGCVSFATHAVPAGRVPIEALARPRSPMVPIDFSLLRQQPPPSHLIGARDVLGVYIQDMVPSVQNRQEPTVLNVPVATSQDYYPPLGLIVSPAVGLPMVVTLDGTLSLPLLPPLKLEGLTIPEASERVRRAYSVDRRILEPGRDRVLISLIRPRVERVLVVRDDISFPPVYQPQGNAALLTRRGTGQVIDLPAYENDVMHALAASGGLPGIDAFSTVWIFRGRVGPQVLEAFKHRVDAGESPEAVFRAAMAEHSVTHIPLRVLPGEPLPFCPEDVVLQGGDVVYLQTRQSEYFFAGGLLPPGQVPLPRDYDLDVLGAVTLATGAVGGPAGGIGSVALNYKGAYNPGAIIPPTRVLVLRRLPDGQQIQIRVDLKKALHEPRERLIVAPGDIVMLYYKPCEAFGNFMLNTVTFNVSSWVVAGK